MRTIRLMIVDDHELFLKGIESVLEKESYIRLTGVFNNAQSALKALKNEVPDLLITDISMPEMNGVEFINAIKKQYPNLKILVVSMFKQKQELKGIQGYLLKETGYSELITAIQDVVWHHKTYMHKDVDTALPKLEFNKTILTKREQEIVKLIAKELTSDEIAEHLFLSRHTIDTHKKNIFQKLQVNTVTGLIKKAMYYGYITE